MRYLKAKSARELCRPSSKYVQPTPLRGLYRRAIGLCTVLRVEAHSGKVAARLLRRTLACAALLLYILEPPAAVHRASALGTLPGAQSKPVSGGYTATLPLIARAPASSLSDPIIYDCDGEVSTTHWLTTTFGAVTWTQSESIPISAIRGRCGDQPATIIAHVQDSSGNPLEGVTVVFSWPDAPALPPELHNCGLDRGVYGPTNMNGDIGFGLGGGAYYYPPDGGPHTVWLPGGACLAGLGMLGGTNHWHVDGDWTMSGVAASLSPGLRTWGFSPQCPANLEDVSGREVWVLRCAH
jgi:hypothetical protein